MAPRAPYRSAVSSRVKQFATAVYQAELTYQLRNLGYEIEAGKRGAPEIKGYSQEYLDASSPRRQQIEQAMAKSGFSGPEAAQIAAHNTRDKKEIHTPAEVMEAHRQLAAKFGNQADRVVAEARERAHTQEQNRVPDPPQRAQEAVSYAKERNFEREAVIDQRDIMRDALRRGMGDLTFSQVRDNFEHRHAIGEFQTVAAQKHDTGPTIDDARNHRRRTSDSGAHAARPEHGCAHHERRTRCVSRRCA